jgi:hypothetical protein
VIARSTLELSVKDTHFLEPPLPLSMDSVPLIEDALQTKTRLLSDLSTTNQQEVRATLTEVFLNHFRRVQNRGAAVSYWSLLQVTFNVS